MRHRTASKTENHYGSPEEVAETLITMADRLYPGISRMCVPGNTLDDAALPG